MPSIATPLFAGDLYDTALRLAHDQPARPNGASPKGSDGWRQMLELGWQAVLVPEEHGGVGAQLADFAGIIEAVATQALPVPLIDRCALAPSLLAAASANRAAVSTLQACAEGTASVATVLHAAPQQHVTARPRLDNKGVLQGSVRGADLSEPATHVLFDAESADGQPVLVLLEAAPLEARTRRYMAVDGRITAEIDVGGVRAGEGQVLLRGARAANAIEAAQQLGSLLGCVRTVSACGAMIEQTVAYLNVRVQFGVALSTFQALRHRTVEMYVSYENARGLVRSLVLQHAHAPDPRQIARARLYVQTIGRKVGESAIQLHGGMGMSEETLAARLAMHVLMTGLQYGDASDCLDWLSARMANEAETA
jgi:alkylation response protein AidB-like acyl-CoA dehydrogenase